MSRTYRRSWKQEEDNDSQIGWSRMRTQVVVKEQEGRGCSMVCPDGSGCDWCNYKTKKYYDIKSGVNDWK